MYLLTLKLLRDDCHEMKLELKLMTVGKVQHKVPVPELPSVLLLLVLV